MAFETRRAVQALPAQNIESEETEFEKWWKVSACWAVIIGWNAIFVFGGDRVAAGLFLISLLSVVVWAAFPIWRRSWLALQIRRAKNAAMHPLICSLEKEDEQARARIAKDLAAIRARKHQRIELTRGTAAFKGGPFRISADLHSVDDAANQEAEAEAEAARRAKV